MTLEHERLRNREAAIETELQSAQSQLNELNSQLDHTMDASGRKRWIRPVILLGAVYFIFGIAFARFAGWAASNSMRVTWNRLGFLASAVAFAVHIGYEHFRLGNSPRISASHVSMAVALGAFALAVSANLHGLWVGSSHQRLLAVALVAWPTLTGVPAFVVALIVTGLALKRWSTLSK